MEQMREISSREIREWRTSLITEAVIQAMAHSVETEKAMILSSMWQSGQDQPARRARAQAMLEILNMMRSAENELDFINAVSLGKVDEMDDVDEIHDEAAEEQVPSEYGDDASWD